MDPVLSLYTKPKKFRETFIFIECWNGLTWWLTNIPSNYKVKKNIMGLTGEIDCNFMRSILSSDMKVTNTSCKLNVATIRKLYYRYVVS